MGPGQWVLVVGTDIEALAIALAEQLLCQVIAVLPEPGAAKRARELSERRGLQALLEFRAGQVDDLPFGRDAFAVVVAKSLRPDPGYLIQLRELVRVLAPGGTFIASESTDSSHAIGLSMDLWQKLLVRFELSDFEIHVSRVSDVCAAHKLAD